MLTSGRNRTLISVIIAVIVCIIIIWSAPTTPLQSKGIILPAKQTLPATNPKNITLTTTSSLLYQNLGLIRIIRHATKASPQAEQSVVKLAKKLAAKVGANMIVVKMFFRTREAAGIPSFEASYNFYGEAVYNPAKMNHSNSLSLSTKKGGPKA